MGGERTLTDEDVTAIVDGLKDCQQCPYTCKHMTADQAEWVETAEKYVDTKKIPTLGKMVDSVDDLAYQIGITILKVAAVGSSGGLVVYLLIKVGVIKLGGVK